MTKKNKLEELANSVKKLIVETLRLEDVSSEDIDTDEPLFFDGLGLDSLDALEIGVAISKKYNIKLNNDPEKNQKIFYSVGAIAQYLSKEIE